MQKIYDENLKKIIDGVKLVTTYAKPLIEKEKIHNSACKAVYYVIFDKNYTPYILYLIDKSDLSYPNNQNYDYFVYRINKKALDLNKTDQVAQLQLQILKNSTHLDYLQVLKRSYLHKKLGSKLLEFFDYFSFMKGSKKARGLSSALNKSFINQQNLNEFYKRNGFYVSKVKSTYSLYNLSKEFDYHKVKEYAKQFITIKKDNIIFKFNIPDYYKPMVQDVLKNETPAKTYPIATINADLIRD